MTSPPPTLAASGPAAGGERPEPVLLILADISGYTRYMTANAKTLAHSHAVITELITALARGTRHPMEVVKLEGDAVFLCCRKGPEGSWDDAARRDSGAQLEGLFRVFRETQAALQGSVTCSCSACRHIERLRLKVIVHSGEALFHRVLHFIELAGVDVILAHRLLKNSVEADRYLLLTERAWQDVILPPGFEFVSGSESYADLGRVATRVCAAPPDDGPDVHPGTWESTHPVPALRPVRLWWRLWTGMLRPGIGPGSRSFRNIETGVPRFERILWAALMLLLTPIAAPVGMVRALFHRWRTPRQPASPESPHR